MFSVLDLQCYVPCRQHLHCAFAVTARTIPFQGTFGGHLSERIQCLIGLAEGGCNVSSWPIAPFRTHALNGRFRGRSGRGPIAALSQSRRERPEADLLNIAIFERKELGRDRSHRQTNRCIKS